MNAEFHSVNICQWKTNCFLTVFLMHTLRHCDAILDDLDKEFSSLSNQMSSNMAKNSLFGKFFEIGCTPAIL